MTLLPNAVDNQILEAYRASTSPDRSFLVALTGIDGSGKSYYSTRLARELQKQGLRLASIHADDWLIPLPDRFQGSNPAEYFYTNGLRLDELFSQLILPLQQQRSLTIEANYAAETSVKYSKKIYQFEAIDIILLEGIYLLKQHLQRFYDFSVWIECSFETALQRAIARSQEGLSPQATIQAYESIYFPAQLIHFQRDRPQTAATLIIHNDPAISNFD